ncbi:MAG: DMT family transporter [Campylobacteraceae bacterium]|nr:DMT family transporter [Campylobacteraceae bacterium]
MFSLPFPKNSFQAQIYAIFATILIAGSFFASQRLSGVLTPSLLTLIRFILATIFLAPFVLFSKTKRTQLLYTMPRAMIISLFYSLYFMIMFEALKTTTVLNTGTLYTLVPFVTALFAFVAFKDRLGYKRMLAFIIGTIGTVWVIFEGNIERILQFNLQEGDGLFILGAISMCVYGILIKALYCNDDLLVLVFCTLIGGTVWMGIGTIFFDAPVGAFEVDFEFILCMLYLAIGTTIFTLFLLQSATVVLGPVRVMSYVYLNPIIVALLLFIIEGKTIPTIVIPGVLLSCLATWILQGISDHSLKKREEI